MQSHLLERRARHFLRSCKLFVYKKEAVPERDPKELAASSTSLSRGVLSHALPRRQKPTGLTIVDIATDDVADSVFNNSTILQQVFEISILVEKESRASTLKSDDRAQAASLTDPNRESKLCTVHRQGRWLKDSGFFLVGKKSHFSDYLPVSSPVVKSKFAMLLYFSDGFHRHAGSTAVDDSRMD